MGVKGGFCVELVEAVSKERYKEHIKDGCAEVEPELEYFVNIEKIQKLPNPC
jgi:hypothetical protein